MIRNYATIAGALGLRSESLGDASHCIAAKLSVMCTALCGVLDLSSNTDVDANDNTSLVFGVTAMFAKT